MRFNKAVISCVQKNYAGFSGRAPRSEYWYFSLFVGLGVLAGFVAMGIADVVVGGNSASAIFAVVAVVAGLGLFLPSLAVGIRRLHDTDSSGWWYLLFLLPYVGGLVMIVWFCVKGTPGPNRFGPDPLNPTDVDAFQ